MYVLIFYIIIFMLCCVICFCKKSEVMRKKRESIQSKSLRRGQEKILKKNMNESCLEFYDKEIKEKYILSLKYYEEKREMYI